MTKRMKQRCMSENRTILSEISIVNLFTGKVYSKCESDTDRNPLVYYVLHIVLMPRRYMQSILAQIMFPREFTLEIWFTQWNKWASVTLIEFDLPDLTVYLDGNDFTVDFSGTSNPNTLFERSNLKFESKCISLATTELMPSCAVCTVLVPVPSLLSMDHIFQSLRGTQSRTKIHLIEPTRNQHGRCSLEQVVSIHLSLGHTVRRNSKNSTRLVLLQRRYTHSTLLQRRNIGQHSLVLWFSMSWSLCRNWNEKYFNICSLRSKLQLV